MAMYFSYIDESGDDGLPGSSPLFVLSGVYLQSLNWQQIFGQLQTFRRSLKVTHGLPVRTEIHAKPLLRGKKPYNTLLSTNLQRRRLQAKEILDRFCQQIATLPIKVINVVIIKDPYSLSIPLLDVATTFLIQRIENDLAPWDNPQNFFIIITDPGREGRMRRTARRIRRYNPVPSHFGGARNIPIRSLIEDPLPKNSAQSYFIQMADFVATTVYLYVQHRYLKLPIPKRIAQTLISNQPTPGKAIIDWMDTLRPVFNTQASKTDPYGVVIYP